nr:hypothetical protein [Pandoravirus massiliensis]
MEDMRGGVVHFVRSTRDCATFQQSAPEDIDHLVRVGVVDVGRARSLAMPQPTVNRVVLWTTETLGASSAHTPAHVGSPSVYRRCAPLFKSAIQKCVRRRMPGECVQFAWGLVNADGLDQLLRRALVILIEDAVALPEVPVLVWLMAAHAKGFCLDVADIGLVVNAMHRAAALAVHDCVPPPEPTAKARACLGGSANHPIVDALLLRVCYGGTPGDMRMLARAASLWQSRLGGATRTQWQEAMETLVGAVRPAADPSHTRSLDMPPDIMASLVASVPIEAADFHCFPHLCVEVTQAVGRGRYTTEAVREAIWHHRSSTNLKRPWTDPRTPTALASNSLAAEWPDDRTDAGALLRTAHCWTVVSVHVDRAARRAIDHLSESIACATDGQTDGTPQRKSQKRTRTTTSADKRSSSPGAKGHQSPCLTQRSIRRFFRPNTDPQA